MNIESLKAGFLSYLQELEKNNGTSQEDTSLNDYSDISIFTHAKEFKDYISDEYDVSPDIISMSVSDILKLEVVNGKLVDTDKLAEEQEDNAEENINTDAEKTAEANPEQTPESTETTPQPEGANAPVEGQVKFDETAVTDILNSLMEDERFSGAIDADKNGNMSKKELSEFFNTISGLDGDKTNVSLEDILSAAEAIANNEFSATPEPQTYYDEVNDATTEKSDYVPNTPSAAQSANTGGSMAPSSGTVSEPVTNPEAVEHKDYDKMTKEELQSELSNAQSKLAEKQTTLNDTIAGNTPELQELQENIDKKYEEYQEALQKVDEDKAKQVDDLKKSIDAKEEEINNKDIEIANQENVVSTCETNYQNAVSTRENLETTKEALVASSQSCTDDEQKASIQAQINEISDQIDTAKQQEETAKQALDEANTTLENLNKEREDLQSGENGLNELNSRMSQLENEISEQYPEIKEYQNQYNEAKEKYNTAKDTALVNAKEAVAEEQNEIKNINSAINKKDNANSVKDYFKNSMGEDIVEFAAQFIGCNEADGSADKFLASWTNSKQTPWCAAFVQYIYEHSDAAGSLPEWYSSIDNKWSCGNLYRAGQAAGAQINGADSQTGDMVIFDWDKSDNCVHDHVGIIVSIENGVVKTIEGNTSNQVAYRTYKIDDPRLTYFKMT